MNVLGVSFLTMLAICGCVHPMETPDVAQSNRFYLHFFDPFQPRWILTTPVHLAEDFHAVSERGEVSGRIEKHHGKLHAKLRGDYYGTGSLFDSDVELEKQFSPGFYVGSSVFFLTSYVLTTNSDYKQFLAKLPGAVITTNVPDDLLQSAASK
jgi:hypothetical protein